MQAINLHEDALEIAKNLSINRLNQIRNYMNPPLKIVHVMQIVVFMAFDYQNAPSWTDIRRAMNPINFIQKLIDFDLNSLTQAKKNKINQLLVNENMESQQFKNGLKVLSAVACPLLEWALIMLK